MTLRQLSDLQLEHDHRLNPNFPKEYLVRVKFSDKTANELERAVCAYINLHGGMAERRKNQGRKIGDKKNVTNVLGHTRTLGSEKWIPGTGRNGTPDVSGIYKGRPIGIEVKIGADKMSQAQLDYKADFEAAGGIYIIAKTFEQFVRDVTSIT